MDVGAKVGAIAESYEFNLAVRRSAKMDPNITYRKIEEILEGVHNKSIDLGFVDTFALVGYKKGDVSEAYWAIVNKDPRSK